MIKYILSNYEIGENDDKLKSLNAAVKAISKNLGNNPEMVPSVLTRFKEATLAYLQATQTSKRRIGPNFFAPVVYPVGESNP